MSCSKQKLYVLIGVREAHYPEEEDIEEPLALFTSEKLAKEYELKSRLSTYQHHCMRGQHGRNYRKKSLLSGYCYSRIELYEESDLRINPTL